MFFWGTEGRKEISFLCCHSIFKIFYCISMSIRKVHMSKAHCIFLFSPIPTYRAPVSCFFHWKSRNEIAGAISTPASDQQSYENLPCSTYATVPAMVRLFHSAVSGGWAVVVYWSFNLHFLDDCNLSMCLSVILSFHNSVLNRDLSFLSRISVREIIALSFANRSPVPETEGISLPPLFVSPVEQKAHCPPWWPGTLSG